MPYHHLNQAERYQIYALKRAGTTLTQIACELSRSAATISRELKRGTGARGYRADQAQRLAQARAQGSRNARCIASDVWDQVRLGVIWFFVLFVAVGRNRAPPKNALGPWVSCRESASNCLVIPSNCPVVLASFSLRLSLSALN
jgi:Helix-turn-helix domain